MPEKQMENNECECLKRKTEKKGRIEERTFNRDLREKR